LSLASEAVGPGSYLEKNKKDFNSMFKPKTGAQNLQFGVEKRFDWDKEDIGATPGPGSYND